MDSSGWRKLNAYVDGELDASEAADLANAAAHDAETAEQVSLLYSLKGSIHAAFPLAPVDLASVLPARRSHRLSTAIVTIAAAAAAACILLFALPADTPTREASNALFASARTLHNRWLVDETNKDIDSPPVVLAALSRFGRIPVVPDLESTGLAVALVSVSDVAGSRVLQIGYRGTHGCHLSLFVFDKGQSPVPTGPLRRLERVHAWKIKDLGYLLFARGMDENRFALIAEKVENATRVNAPLSERDRLELAENKRNSTSCKT